MSELKVCHLKDRKTGEVRVVVAEKCYRSRHDINGILVKEYISLGGEIVYSTDPQSITYQKTALIEEEAAAKFIKRPITKPVVASFEQAVNRNAVLMKTLR